MGEKHFDILSRVKENPTAFYSVIVQCGRKITFPSLQGTKYSMEQSLMVKIHRSH